MAWNYTYVSNKGFDFFALMIVMVIEIVELLAKFVLFCRNGGENDDASYDPLFGTEGAVKGRIQNSFSTAQVHPEYSRDTFNVNNES